MKLNLVYCAACGVSHEPGKHIRKKRKGGEANIPAQPSGFTKPKPVTADVPAQAPSTITFERDRVSYNAYQRDYKKAKRLGLTVEEYRARQVEKGGGDGRDA